MSEAPSTATAPAVWDTQTHEMMDREQEREFVIDFAEKSDSAKAPFYPIWDQVTDNYLVNAHSGLTYSPSGMLKPEFRTGASVRQGSTLKDTETHQVIRSLTAQALSLILGGNEWLAADPIGADDPEKARLLTRLLRATLDGPGVYRKFHMIFSDAFLLGTCICECGYRELERLQVTNRPVMDLETGQPVPGSDIAPVVYESGPYFALRDNYQFYPDPSGTSIQDDMCGVASGGSVAKYHAEVMAERGLWHPESVQKAIAAHKNSGDLYQRRERFPELSYTVPAAQGRLGTLEYWGDVPWRPRDGARNRVITLLCGEWVRGHINPYVDGRIPFKEAIVNPVSGRFWGLSPGEVIRYLQDTADTLLMVHNDVTSAAVAAPILVGNAFGGDINRIRRRRPNDVIGCVDVTQVQPFPVDFNVLQFAAAELVRRKIHMREATGQTNPVQAIPQGGEDRTATEATLLFQAASQQVSVMVQLLERDFMPWLGRTIHSRLRQFMPQDGVLATLNGETFGVTLEDIDYDADVRFLGSRQMGNRFQKSQSLNQLLAIVAASPGVLEYGGEIITRILRDGGDVEDAERLVAGLQQALRNYEMRQMIAGMLGGHGEGGGGSAPNIGPGRPTEADEVASGGRALVA